jgi:Thioredoxin
MSWPFAPLWASAFTYDAFVKASKEHCELWSGVYRTAKVPAWAIEQAAGLARRFRFVVLAEDWCGDASSSVPVVVRFAEATGSEIRILRRDEHPEVMDRYLSPTGARAIPVVIVLTDAMTEVGHWGSRPAELQAFVSEQRGKGVPSKSYFPEVRRWYAKDKGESTLREILAVMAGGAGPA